MQRSVERVKGVRKIEIDLNTGRGELTFKRGKAPLRGDIWRAVQDSGFTPVRMEVNGSVYKGPSPKAGSPKELE